ncbi:MarR family transcriptional regulator [Streptomyces cocklensis]|uniref:MarR family transcriptional regulator n=1 Tax=Actinacidiphila cocklensis TaxID=887465 RepID=A0A9W4GVQ8_9ACTN|nr:MarR family transcriptional regulator [Actinacidiphila cocklensis]MDD1059697.1 MarR family transcriptional regulator [Actinacidiphila cocklensis]WSX72570.1 MarR family transcriptional regulator [Streptomyces sp. NBC_00899]WSX81361.1 MarR family transcriptional regulator [Streptomyces sp. NBC_00899]CAG6396967.1 MarR family transcriptional regulator [Actinacidiphila cocklensis]
MTYVTQVFTDLVRVETRLYNAVNARLQTELGLGLGQFEFMAIIDRVPGCRVLDIAREVAITVGATSKAVDRLEAAGWCVRSAHPQDRRSSVLGLTAEGAALLERSRPVVEAELAALTVGVPSGGLDQVAATMATLRTALERRSPAGAE